MAEACTEQSECDGGTIPVWGDGTAIRAYTYVDDLVEGFRWALLGTETAPGPIIFVSALVGVGLLISGAFYFRRMEKTFADVV